MTPSKQVYDMQANKITTVPLTAAEIAREQERAEEHNARIQAFEAKKAQKELVLSKLRGRKVSNLNNNELGELLSELFDRLGMLDDDGNLVI